MSFEDDMIDAGFRDEGEYLEHLCNDAENRRAAIRQMDGQHFKPKTSIDLRKEYLFYMQEDGRFISGAPRVYSKHRNTDVLKVGNIIHGPRFDYLEPEVYYDLPSCYSQSENFDNGIALCCRDGIWGLINTRMEEVFFSHEGSIEKSINTSKGRLFVFTTRTNQYSQKYSGLINEEGLMIIPPIFGGITTDYRGYIGLFPGSFMLGPHDYKFYTQEELIGILKTPEGYFDWEKGSWPEQLVPFVHGIRAIKHNGFVGVENEKHSMILDCKYDSVSGPFLVYDHKRIPSYSEIASKYVLKAYYDRIVSCFDLEGNLVFRLPGEGMISIEYKSGFDRRYHMYASLFKSKEGWYMNTYARINTDGSFIIEDDEGTQVLLPSIYDWGFCVLDENDEPNYIEVLQKGKYGLIDKSLKEIVPCKYDLISGMFFSGFSSDGLMSVKRDGKYGVMNTQWKEVVPCIYGTPQV